MGAPSTRSDGDERWDIESRNLLEDIDGRAEAPAAAVAMGAGLAAVVDQHRATWARRPA